MSSAVQITFRNMNPSKAIEELIHEKAERLFSRFDGVVGCRVTIERPHRSHQHGNLFEVHIETAIPGKDVVVSRAHTATHEHEEPQPAIRDAFAAAERQLAEAKERMRRDVKTHSK